jgi:hypothetical protein
VFRVVAGVGVTGRNELLVLLAQVENGEVVIVLQEVK